MSVIGILLGMNNAHTSAACFIVVSAPGYYGDTTRVLSAHRTARAALRARGSWPGLVVRACEGKRKGDVFYRASESLYPVVRA